MNHQQRIWNMTKHLSPQQGLAYLEGQLDAAQRAKVERHLADCVTCRVMMQQHQAVHNMLYAMGRDDAARSPVIPNWWEVRERHARQLQWQGVMRVGRQMAATVLVVLLLATTAVFLLNRPPSEIEPAAPTETIPALTPASATPMPAARDIMPTTTDAPILATPSQAVPTTVAVKPPLTETPVPIQVGSAPPTVPLLSSLGRLAVVQEHTLFVETAVHTANLVEIAQDIDPDIHSEDGPVANPVAAWSPDGSRLAFFTGTETAVSVTIWDSRTGQTQTLAQLIHKSLPAVPFTSFRWSPEGDRLLLTTSDRLTADSEWTSGVWIADLANGELILAVEAQKLVDTAWLTTDSFFLQLNCGRDCATVMAYNTNRTRLWKAYEEDESVLSASTFYALNAAQSILVNLNSFVSQPVVDVIDTTTGELNSVWPLAAGEIFAHLPPHLSPNGRFLTFNTTSSTTNTLHLIDRDGHDYGSRENSVVLDWRPDGGPVVAQTLTNGQNQLVYWPLDGAAARVFVRPRSFTFPGGQWRMDGQRFIYSALDSAIGASYLYVWSPEEGVPVLVYSAAAIQPFQDFIWTPDGSRVFFTLGGQGLWYYDLVANQVQQVSVTKENTHVPSDSPN